MTRGQFLTFEGIEGSGKSTQARRLYDALSNDYALRRTHEPGDTALGARVRKILLDPEQTMVPRAELLLYAAERAEHVETLIEPALANGTHVLCDRFSDATVAYQGHARGLGVDLVSAVNIGHLEPDLTLLFDLPVEIGLTRARRRNQVDDLAHESRFEEEALSFHERVRSGYLEIAKNSPNRIRIIDGDRSEDEIFNEVHQIVIALLDTTRSTS